MDRYEALKHAAIGHAGQVDKCGRPYILHAIAVAEAAASHGPSAIVSVDALYTVGLLHDVREETDYRGIEGRELSGDEARALITLTRQTERRTPETYAEYVERICRSSRLACIVKLADLWHNLSPERQACLPSKEAASLEKRYLNARNRIWETLGDEWWPASEDAA
jgi:(p)ppGpp synthase/HD superfamily hydrolase